jgi:NADH dehydrogenase (ubiquinone) 1 alpha subcomplex subunit 6
MYSLGMPVSAIRTKIRQEFEKHRYVSQISVVDVLLYKSHAEFQVSSTVHTLRAYDFDTGIY